MKPRRDAAVRPTSPWSVKGIDRDIRAAARQMAHGAGMTLGAWLSRLILEAAASRTRPGNTGLQTMMDEIRRLTAQIDDAETRAADCGPAATRIAPLSAKVALLSHRLDSLRRPGGGDCQPLDRAKADISDGLRRLENARSAPRRQGDLFTPRS